MLPCHLGETNMTYSVYFGIRVLVSGLTYRDAADYCIYHQYEYPEQLLIWPDLCLGVCDD